MALHVDQPSGLTPDEASVEVLRRCGWAFVASNCFGALAAVVLVSALWPSGEDPEEEELGEEEGETVGGPASFSASSFLRESSAMMARSFFLQGSVFAMAVVASHVSGGSDALASHAIIMQLWMLESNIVDGFADVGTMLGSKLLGELSEIHDTKREAREEEEEKGEQAEGIGKAMRTLTNRVMSLSLATGLCSALVLGGASEPIQRVFSHDPAVLSQLDKVWVLLCVMQVPNACVFGYDGLIAATRSFEWVFANIASGVILLLAPCLVATLLHFKTLLAIWCGKAMLNAWRLGGAFFLIHVTHWKLWGPSSPGGGLEGPLLRP